MARKTVDIVFAINKANFFFATSEPAQRPQRLAIASYLEVLLFETGNYKGYVHVDKNDDSRRSYIK